MQNRTGFYEARVKPKSEIRIHMGVSALCVINHEESARARDRQTKHRQTKSKESRKSPRPTATAVTLYWSRSQLGVSAVCGLRALQPQSDLDKGNGKSHSDRSQVIGGKLLIGQLAPWVTWGI